MGEWLQVQSVGRFHRRVVWYTGVTVNSVIYLFNRQINRSRGRSNLLGTLTSRVNGLSGDIRWYDGPCIFSELFM